MEWLRTRYGHTECARAPTPKAYVRMTVWAACSYAAKQVSGMVPFGGCQTTVSPPKTPCFGPKCTTFSRRKRETGAAGVSVRVLWETRFPGTFRTILLSAFPAGMASNRPKHRMCCSIEQCIPAGKGVGTTTLCIRLHVSA